MLFSRSYTAFVLLTLSVFTVASNIPSDKRTNPTVTVTVTAPASTATIPAGDCNTGDAQCCNSLSKSSDPGTSLLLALLGVVVQGVDVPIGLNCSPITIIGVGGGSCDAHPVCCQDNSHGGLISIGCLPISL